VLGLQQGGLLAAAAGGDGGENVQGWHASLCARVQFLRQDQERALLGAAHKAGKPLVWLMYFNKVYSVAYNLYSVSIKFTV
jgi:hypothetical protein